MQTVSQKALIREMSPEQLQAHADAIYSRHNGDITKITQAEHTELKECLANYFQLTGQVLQPAVRDFQMF
jgi:hypothetical protein